MGAGVGGGAAEGRTSGDGVPGGFVGPSERGAVAQLGAAAIDLFAGGRELYSVFVQTLYHAARGKRERGAVVRQMFEMGNRSLAFVTITMGAIGMIITYQIGIQQGRIVPDYTMIGAVYLELVVRDMAASLGALMLATRVGAGIAAEIGSMVVTEQVDALRMCAADPIEFLVVPRFLASLVMTGVLVIWAAFVMYCTGAGTAFLAFGVSPATFFNLTYVHPGELVTGLTKCFAYGAAIPIVSAYCGLSAFGGSEGVGWATTRAVVNSSLATIVLNFFISSASLLLFGA
jgi:phospholipid/cholesterol/gamma-HCH transport system permease protein